MSRHAAQQMADRIALTVDLEPDWGIAGTRAYREVTFRFLRFLDERGMRATFFVVSDLLDESREPAAAIAERNEVGSHGSGHRLLRALSRDEARDELIGSRRRLEELGVPVRGFRAPFFQRRPDLADLLREAGYGYDASLGSVYPGPRNLWLGRLPCPARRDGMDVFATSAMAGGLLPLSLTWLRVLAPVRRPRLPAGSKLVYLHLHEFLPAETARCLPAHLRPLLTRNCGEAAWRVLDAALGSVDAEFTTCAELLAPRGEKRGSADG